MMDTVQRTLKCYIDTSVFNWTLALGREEEQKGTKLFLERCGKGSFEAYVSDIVLAELAATPDEGRRQKLMAELSAVTAVNLEFDEAARQLAERYVEAKIIPARARDDARHAAVAVVNNLDVIVSWNMEHLVRLITRRGVNAINQLEGYKPIEIATPLEVL